MPMMRLWYRLFLPAALAAVLTSCGSSATLSPTATRAVRTSTATARPTIPTPTAAAEERSAVNPMALGGNHTCALTVPAGIVCWGNNRYGQLGNGTFLGGGVPAEVSRMTSGVIFLAA